MPVVVHAGPTVRVGVAVSWCGHWGKAGGVNWRQRVETVNG